MLIWSRCASPLSDLLQIKPLTALREHGIITGMLRILWRGRHAQGRCRTPRFVFNCTVLLKKRSAERWRVDFNVCRYLFIYCFFLSSRKSCHVKCFKVDVLSCVLSVLICTVSFLLYCLFASFCALIYLLISLFICDFAADMNLYIALIIYNTHHEHAQVYKTNLLGKIRFSPHIFVIIVKNKKKKSLKHFSTLSVCLVKCPCKPKHSCC